MIKKTFTAVLLAVSVTGYAQKIKVLEGSLAPLKGQKSIMTEFTYDNMTIGKDGLPEQEYLTKRKGELNEKEAGRGDTFTQKWVDNRSERYAPKFRELFTEHAKLTSSVDEKAAYTLIFHTTRTEPGWNVGVMRVPAFIDGEVTIVETAHKDKVIARISALKAPGRDVWGADFDPGARLQEAYAKSGKELGELIAKETR
ncbi:hypothetical protein KK062_22990 [Fulvivirgaceae bacterium PWU5]|uniref:Uncharacterized protein n=1 Tax=Dawidia cretensis TaxID=2782350 RepID=A0AAP2E118_9BACT|nr:hypothetical protein [Dawidia cretensis]MBT1711128.1 hypothetical protein [Dawidia cretensis]